MIIGPLSSIFDYTTFALLYFVLGAHDIAHAGLFQTGWFVESLMTQTLVIYVIRTNRIPFLQSRPSWPLMATTIAVLAVGLWLPVSPFAGSSRVGDAYFGYASDTRFPTAVGDSLIITLVATEDVLRALRGDAQSAVQRGALGKAASCLPHLLGYDVGAAGRARRRVDGAATRRRAG
jgi:magnesium-transporting ATPase (P-type)